MESYTHEYAKNTVFNWLAGDPNGHPLAIKYKPDRIYKEYPLCLDKEGELCGHSSDLVWDEREDFDGRVPTYQQCLDRGFLPIAVFDVAAIYEGQIADVFEIIHRNPPSEDKWRFLIRAFDRCPFNVHLLRAKKVLQWPASTRMYARPDWMEYALPDVRPGMFE